MQQPDDSTKINTKRSFAPLLIECKTKFTYANERQNRFKKPPKHTEYLKRFF